MSKPIRLTIEADKLPVHLRQYFQPVKRCGKCYVCRMVEVFREVRRVLHPSGTCWINIGDSYAGGKTGRGDLDINSRREGRDIALNPIGYGYNHPVPLGYKSKDLLGIPWLLAFALRADGWWLRQEIIWAKTAPMPESVTDRCTKAHEQVFLLAKSRDYFFDAEAIREPNSETSHTGGQYRNGWKYTAIGHGSSTSQMRVGVPIPANGRNKRSVWTLGPESYSGSHYAVMPTKLVEPMVLSGTSAHGCCSKCLAPWERVVERGETHGRSPNDGNGYKKTLQKVDGVYGRNFMPNRTTEITTLGWQPTCTCFGHFELVEWPREYDEDGDETVASQIRPPRRVFVQDGDMPEPVPCTVLDPFAGSGTTLAVALKFGRRAIGIDLDARNMALAHDRIARMQPMLFNEVTA